MDKLQQNPQLQDPIQLAKAIEIFSRLSEWNCFERWIWKSNQVPMEFSQAIVTKGEPNKRKPEFMNRLDEDIFSKIYVVPKRVSESPRQYLSAQDTVQHLLTDDSAYKAFFQDVMPEWEKLLRGNPKVANNPARAIAIFKRICNWGYAESTSWLFKNGYFHYDLVSAQVYPGAPTANDKMAEFMNHLDHDLFSKITIVGIEKTVQQLLDNDIDFQSFMSEPRFADSSATPPSQFEIATEPAQTCPPVPQPPLILERCEIVEFNLSANDSFKSWINGKTFGGILFKWDSMGGEDLLGDTWENSKTYWRCPRKIIDRYIKALMEAARVKYQSFDDLQDHHLNGVAILGFGPLIHRKRIISGFFLEAESKIYTDPIPWEELKKKGVQVKL